MSSHTVSVFLCVYLRRNCECLPPPLKNCFKCVTGSIFDILSYQIYLYRFRINIGLKRHLLLSLLSESWNIRVFMLRIFKDPHKIRSFDTIWLVYCKHVVGHAPWEKGRRAFIPCPAFFTRYTDRNEREKMEISFNFSHFLKIFFWNFTPFITLRIFFFIKT